MSQVIPRFGTTVASEMERLAERNRVRMARAATMKQGHGRVKVQPYQYEGEENGGRPLGPHNRLAQLIRRNVAFKGNATGTGRRSRSHRTREAIRESLHFLFGVLLKTYPLKDPANLDGRHLQHLFDWMEERFERGLISEEAHHETGRLGIGTIKNYVSCLRHLCRWIGQPDLIERAGVKFSHPGLARRRIAAEHDKSWEGADIDIGAKVDELWRAEPWVAMAVLAQHAYGLRRKEAVCLRPAIDWAPGTGLHVATVRPGPAARNEPGPVVDSDFPSVVVRCGAKNGKVRVVAIWEDWQQQVLVVLQDWLREEGRPNGAIGGSDRDLKGNLARYSRVLAAAGLTKKLIGATGHGLRAGFACRMLESFGVQAPVRGADLRQADREATDQAAAATSVALGHGRLAATSYYIGARNVVLPDAQPRSAQAADIEALRNLMRQTKRARAAIRAYDRAVKQEKAELAVEYQRRPEVSEPPIDQATAAPQSLQNLAAGAKP